METGQQQGMQTFAQSVAMRLNEGRLALQKDASAGHWANARGARKGRAERLRC